ncbi:hypothetical protein [Gordonia sp. NPDC003585]|uniref:hypothetical protein n=1 Tax=Gordonia sp. NPDC003585 TaxID=3154275 RepID=UPI0033AB601A
MTRPIIAGIEDSFGPRYRLKRVFLIFYCSLSNFRCYQINGQYARGLPSHCYWIHQRVNSRVTTGICNKFLH